MNYAIYKIVAKMVGSPFSGKSRLYLEFRIPTICPVFAGIQVL